MNLIEHINVYIVIPWLVAALVVDNRLVVDVAAVVVVLRVVVGAVVDVVFKKLLNIYFILHKKYVRFYELMLIYQICFYYFTNHRRYGIPYNSSLDVYYK